MKDIKFKIDHGIPYATSLDIADRYGVEHKNVLSAVTNRVNRLTSQPIGNGFASRHILESSYVDARNRTQKLFLFDEAGFAMCTFLFQTDRAIQAQCDIIEQYEAMKAELREKEIEKVKWRYADETLLPFGTEVVRKSFPVAYIAPWLRRRVLPDITAQQITKMVKEGQLEGKFIPLKSIVYADSVRNYLNDLGLLTSQIADELGGDANASH